jgi:acetate kinase
MKILVSNIGSTSFKFRLFDMGEMEREIASGGADRIGQAGGQLKCQVGGAKKALSRDFTDHGQAIVAVLDELVGAGALKSLSDLGAIAFKAVMGGDCEPVCLVDDRVLERMEYFVPVAPAHNPPYIAAMRMFRSVLAETPLVAAFEPGFHSTIPQRRRLYAVSPLWADKYGVKRYGFHGASHRYIAMRTAELMGSAGRIISCHLGGSSSVCAIRDGKSVANSMGLSPQSGLPQGNRAGEFDVFALALLAKEAGMTASQVMAELGGKSGLAAISGTGGDMRDIEKAASEGDERSILARELFATAVRDYIGAYLVELGGADAIVFTGGIGEKDWDLRGMVCREMGFAGIRLDVEKNKKASGEVRVEAKDSQAAIWVMPTNEELVVARLAAEFLKKPQATSHRLQGERQETKDPRR